MKGIVFNEFYKMVEAQHGEDMLDDVIVAADLANGGAYTSVGTYKFEDMLSLVGAYTKASKRSMPCVLDNFGQSCFASWVNYVPAFFAPHRHLFDILEQIDDFHEREVRKLYPDAELPRFVTEARSESVLLLGYHSSKQLGDLATGVIKGAAAHLGVRIGLTAEAAQDEKGPYARLRIELLGNAAPPEGPTTCRKPTLA